MGEVSETYSTILYLKFLQALLVCKDITEFLEEADEFGIDYKTVSVLEIFSQIIGAYTTEHSLPRDIENNVLNFLSIQRVPNENEEKEERSRRIEICNGIISCINRSKGKPEYPFYPSLINHLYHGFIFKTWNHYLYANSPDQMKDLFDSYISIEYYVLYSHAEILNDQEFMLFACNFLLNGAYLEAIEFLLDEIPELENDPIFIARIRKILIENENLLSEYQGNPIEGSESYLEDEDEEYVKDKYFWKLHRKVKKRLTKLKDS